MSHKSPKKSLPVHTVAETMRRVQRAGGRRSSMSIVHLNIMIHLPSRAGHKITETEVRIGWTKQAIHD